MKNLYVTLFSAFLLGSTICTGCAEKKTGSSGEVIEMIHCGNTISRKYGCGQIFL